MDLYQPQGVGRKKRHANEDITLEEHSFDKHIITPVRLRRNDGYDKDRQKTLSLAEGGRGKGEAIFMRADRIVTEKPRRNFYPIPLDSYPGKRENDRQLAKEKSHHEEADINENVSFTVIIPEGSNIPFFIQKIKTLPLISKLLLYIIYDLFETTFLCQIITEINPFVRKRITVTQGP